MQASSKAQARFFQLVRAVQKGDVPPSKVTQNVRDAAKDNSPKDVRDFTKAPKGAPEKITGEKERDDEVAGPSPDPGAVPTTSAPASNHEGINFFDVVGKYNEYGDLLRQEHSLSELAQQLSDIAEYAEYALANEQNDWYDAHTISRNVKEMATYAKEFAKVAKEADSHHLRLQALYDDMGRILERYFDVYDHEKKEDEQFSNASAGSGFGPGAMTNHNSPAIGTDMEPADDMMEVSDLSKRAINIARSRLTEIDAKNFDKLPVVRKVFAAWRIIS